MNETTDTLPLPETSVNQDVNNNIQVQPADTSADLSIEFASKETEASKQQALGAQYAKECDLLTEKIHSIASDVPEELKDQIENFMRKLGDADLSLEERKNVLAFATCKFAFTLSDTKHPDILKSKIQKVLEQPKYSPALKADLDILLTHTDGIIKQYKDSVARQQTASDFGISNNEDIYKTNYDKAIAEYFKGNITEEEFKKYTDNGKAQARKTVLLKNAKETYGWEPVKHIVNMTKYFED